MAQEKPITIIGCGPGAPEYLTEEARTAASSANCLIGSKRLLELFGENGCKKIDVGADVKKTLEVIENISGAGNVCVLVSGDPGLCSLAKPVIKRFGAQSCRVVSGISSVQVAFSRVGLDWYGAKIITAHGEDPQAGYAEFKGEEKIAVLGGRDKSIRWISGLAEYLGEGYTSILCENLTLKDERVLTLSHDELKNAQVSSMAVVLIIKNELFS